MHQTAEILTFPKHSTEPDTWADPRCIADDSDNLAPARGLLTGILCGALFWAGIYVLLVLL